MRRLKTIQFQEFQMNLNLYIAWKKSSIRQIAHFHKKNTYTRRSYTVKIVFLKLVDF